MEYNRLDKRILLSWRLGRVIRMIIIGIIMTAAILFIKNIDLLGSFLKYAYVAASIIGAYLILAFFIIPAFEYRQWGYIISDDRVEIRHGVFFIMNTVIPVIRIQHITISQGPINRKLGIAKINIHTASGQFQIEGISLELAKATAESLKSKLYKRLELQDEK